MTVSTAVQAALISALSLLPAAAQDAPKTSDGGTGAAQAAVMTPEGKIVAVKARAKIKPHVEPRKEHSLFEYQKELGLTDDQMSKMKAAVTSLQDKLLVQEKAINQASVDLRQLVQTNADMKLIRTKLQQIADAEVERQADDIETSRDILDVMTKDQQDKWRAVQKRLSAEARGAGASAPKPTP